MDPNQWSKHFSICTLQHLVLPSRLKMFVRQRLSTRGCIVLYHAVSDEMADELRSAALEVQDPRIPETWDGVHVDSERSRVFVPYGDAEVLSELFERHYRTFFRLPAQSSGAIGRPAVDQATNRLVGSFRLFPEARKHLMCARCLNVPPCFARPYLRDWVRLEQPSGAAIEPATYRAEQRRCADAQRGLLFLQGPEAPRTISAFTGILIRRSIPDPRTRTRRSFPSSTIPALVLTTFSGTVRSRPETPRYCAST